jgi:hypothetical protein
MGSGALFTSVMGWFSSAASASEFLLKHLFRQYYQQPTLTFMLFITIKPSEFRPSLSWPVTWVPGLSSLL